MVKVGNDGTGVEGYVRSVVQLGCWKMRKDVEWLVTRGV